MDIIEYELRRYDNMKNKIDNQKMNTHQQNKNIKDNLNKSSEDFLDIMDEEKPKEVTIFYIIF